jgi:imidazolonepropionase-like amidohydrolase
VSGRERLLLHASQAWLGPGRLIDDPAVVVAGSRIVYAGAARTAPAADREAAGDWFLMPGAVDHHVHIGLSDPRAVLRGGVTAARDLAWPPDDIFALSDVSAATDFEGPRVVAVGPMITATGGYPSGAGWCPRGGWIEVSAPSEAAAAVERLAQQDPAAIKVSLNAEAGPVLSDGVLVAVCDAAHARNLRVTAHVQGTGQTERALGAGVDELAHCPWTERLSDDLVEAIARRMSVVSTLDIHSYGSRTPELERAVDNLARLITAGGRALYGTDLGNGPIPPGIHPGEAFHLAIAGMSPDAILASMTRSSLEPGAPADVVGLGGNPLEDLEALGRVALVVRAGRVRRLDH